MNTNEALKSAAAKHSTDTLVGALIVLDAKNSMSHDERMVYAATADVITERHNIDAAMDEVFMSDTFAGTYADAILVCLAMDEVA